MTNEKKEKMEKIRQQHRIWLLFRMFRDRHRTLIKIYHILKTLILPVVTLEIFVFLATSLKISVAFELNLQDPLLIITSIATITTIFTYFFVWQSLEFMWRRFLRKHISEDKEGGGEDGNDIPR